MRKRASKWASAGVQTRPGPAGGRGRGEGFSIVAVGPKEQSSQKGAELSDILVCERLMLGVRRRGNLVELVDLINLMCFND